MITAPSARNISDQFLLAEPIVAPSSASGSIAVPKVLVPVEVIAPELIVPTPLMLLVESAIVIPVA